MNILESFRTNDTLWNFKSSKSSSPRMSRYVQTIIKDVEPPPHMEYEELDQWSSNHLSSNYNGWKASVSW